MEINSESSKKDYYPPTKIVGFIATKIKQWTNLSGPFIRITIALIIFNFLAYGIPVIFWLITGDLLFDSWQMVVAFLWLGIAPVIIVFFQYSVDDFWNKFEKIADLSKSEFNFFKTEMNKKMFSKRYLIISIIVYVIGLIFLPYVLSEHTYIILLMVYILMIPAAIMWGIIGYLVFYMYFFINRICEIELKIDPFDPDGFGGLSAIGNVTIRVATFISLISLYLPLGIQRMSKFDNEYLQNFLLAGIVILIGTIIFSFFIPLIPVNQLANRSKDKLISNVGKDLNQKLDKNKRNESRIEDNIQILVSFEYYKEIKAMKAWPYSINAILNLIGSIFLPIILFLLGYYL